MILERRGERIEPMRHAHEVLERRRHRHVFDAEWNDRQSTVHGALDFALYLWGVVRLCRVHEHHQPTGVDGIDDGAAPVHTWQYVPGSDPAADPVVFECRAYGIGGWFVVR